MHRNNLVRIALLALVIALLGGTSALAVTPDPDPPVPAAAASAEPASGEASGETSGEASEEAEPLPIVAGTYKGSDGSVLKVKKDGSCTYETTVSGKVNGKAMSGRLTFHGTLEDDGFAFTKVTFFGLDLTKAAASAGYTDGSYWEEAAGVIYVDALGL